MLYQVNEGLSDKKEELEALEARLSATIDQHNEIKETAASEQAEWTAQAEATERELAKMKHAAKAGLVEVDLQHQNVLVEYEQLVSDADKLREGMVRTVVQALDEVIQFKLHIQTSLSQLDAEIEEAAATEKQVVGAV
jgi:kinetochore protein NDC80